MTAARVGLRTEPEAGLPFVLVLRVGDRVDVHRFRTEAERDDFYARVGEHYEIDNTEQRTNR